MAQVARWSRFGWQGITLDVPDAWELTRFDGARRTGYARLSDSDCVRLELRWDSPRPTTSFRAAVDHIIAQTIRRQKIDIERDTHLAELEGKDCETFTCRPLDRRGFSSYNIVSVCRECGRLVMIRIGFHARENIKALARRVLGSLQDHSYDGTDAWSACGLEFAGPDSMELDQALLYPGSADFAFLLRHDRVDVGRVALGSLVLAKAPLGEWFRSFARKRFKKVAWSAEEREVRGHKGLVVAGRLRGLGALVPRLLRRQRFLCRVWHCDVSDRIYFFAVLAREQSIARLAAFLDRVRCHE